MTLHCKLITVQAKAVFHCEVCWLFNACPDLLCIAGHRLFQHLSYFRRAVKQSTFHDMAGHLHTQHDPATPTQPSSPGHGLNLSALCLAKRPISNLMACQAQSRGAVACHVLVVVVLPASAEAKQFLLLLLLLPPLLLPLLRPFFVFLSLPYFLCLLFHVLLTSYLLQVFFLFCSLVHLISLFILLLKLS